MTLPTSFGRTYVNHNPHQTDGEIRIGTILDQLAELNQLGGIDRVVGRKQATVKNVRNPDYSFIKYNQEYLTADLYQPETNNATSIIASLIKKSGQADVGIIEFRNQAYPEYLFGQAQTIARDILSTPDHSIRWVLIIWEQKIKLFIPN